MAVNRRPNPSSIATYQAGLASALLITIAAALWLASPSAASTTVSPGTITADTEWNVSGSPYYLEGLVTVGAGANLSIAPGTTVLASPGAALRVNGRLLINGTASSPAQFNTNTSGAGSWTGIVLDNPALSCILANFTARNATVGLDITNARASVTVDNLSMENSTASALRINASDGVSVAGLRVITSAQAVEVSGSSNVSVAFFVGSRFRTATATTFWIGWSENVTLRGGDLSGGSLRIGASTNVSVFTLTVDAAGAADAIVVLDSPQFTLVSASLRGYQTTGLDVDRSPDMTIVRFNATTSISSFFLQCISLRHSWRVAVSNVTCTSPPIAVNTLSADGATESLFDNVTTSGGFGLYASGASVVRGLRVIGYNPSAFFRGSSEVDYDVDLRDNNTVGGLPILGVYGEPGRQIRAPLNVYMVFVWDSPNTTVGGTNGWLNATVGVYLARSPSSRIHNVSLGGTSGLPSLVWAISLVNSTGFVLENITCPRPLYLEGFSGVLVRDVTSGGIYLWYAENTIVERATVNLTAGSSIAAGFTDYGGRNNTVRDSTASGPVGLRVAFAGPILVENVTSCSRSGGGLSVEVVTASAVTLRRVRMCASTAGVMVTGSDTFVLENSTIEGLTRGVVLSSSRDSVVRWNEFRAATQAAVVVEGSSSNSRIFENAFYANNLSASDSASGAGFWFNAAGLRGNYWDDYAGTDADGDLIGDTPRPIAGGSRADPYPLMRPFDMTPPIAIAPASITVDEDTPATLDGSASWDNQELAGGYWVIHDLGGNQTVWAIVATYVFATPGTWLADLVVFDAWNLSSMARTTVIVRDRTPPQFTADRYSFTADEDTDFNLTVGASDNSPSFPPPGAFRWAGTAGPFALGVTTDSPWVVVRFAEPGHYILSVTASDAAGNQNVSTLEVAVADTTPPTCDPAVFGDPPAAQGATVLLRVQNASDNDPRFPRPDSFRWVVTSPSTKIETAVGDQLGYQTSEPGEYAVALICADPTGNSVTKSLVFITPDSTPPQWTPPSGMETEVGIPTTFSVADASDFSGVAGASWTVDGVVAGQGIVLTHGFESIGSADVSVTIRDGTGNAATFSFTVTVVDRTSPWLTDPTWNASRTVELGAQEEFDVGAFIADNDPDFPTGASFYWYVSVQPMTILGPTDGPQVTLRMDGVGVFVLSLEFRDARGNEARLNVSISVVDTTAPAGLTIAVEPAISLIVGQSFHFVATARDLATISFVWSADDGSGFQGPEGYLSFESVGTHRVRVNCTDASGNVVTSEVLLEVRAPPTTPPGGNPAVYALAALGLVAAAGVGAWTRRRRKIPRTEEPGPRELSPP